jgi:predicted DNA repair protein MutK
MAAGSLLALLDDITTVLDDVSLMAKVAAKKTAGVLGDDLALNAEQVAGIQAERELPVVWAVTKGSLLNKLILVPIALLLSALMPWLINPLLMVGGAYLCYEGFEKIAHKLLPGEEEIDTEAELLLVSHNPEMDMLAFEKEKIKGAIRTDFVLSAEIIVIALGTVKDATFLMQAAVVSGIAFVMTLGVYGVVAGIVKLDDIGFYLLRDKASAFKQALGRGLLAFAPWLMKALSVVGTAAMFLVGGGILLHGIPHSHDFLHGAELFVHQVGWMGGLLGVITPTLLNGLFGVLAGGVVLAVVAPVFALLGKFRGTA